MSHHTHPEEIVGVRYTGWAALDRDPQEDRVEFVCPHCGQSGAKSARRQRASSGGRDQMLSRSQS